MKKTTQEQQPSINAWLDMQKNLWQGWVDSASQVAETARKAMSKNAPPPMLTDLYAQWTKVVGAAMGQAAGAGKESGIGDQVFGKLFDASKVYMMLMEFWVKGLEPLAAKTGGTITPEDLKTIYDKWTKDYQEMMATLWGPVNTEAVRESLDAVDKMAKESSAAAEDFFAPIMENWKKISEIAPKMAAGDQDALTGLYSVFSKNYEVSLGKMLKIPTMGIAREFMERLKKSLDASVGFNTVLSEYTALLYETGLKALGKVYQRSQELVGKDFSTESFKDFYRIWWTINEDTYHELFLSPQYTHLMQEVLTSGLRYRQVLDDLSDKLLETTNLPTKTDMDEIYKTLYELKKEVRGQGRKLKDLYRRFNMASEKEE